MRGFSKIFILFFGFSLIACVGGGSGPTGGDPVGGKPSGGSALGGGVGEGGLAGGPSGEGVQFAGGPVDLDATATTSRTAPQPSIYARGIRCENNDQNIACLGVMGSVPGFQELRLAVYRPDQLGASPVGPPVYTGAGALGTWMGNIPGEGGQILEICLWIAREGYEAYCGENLLLRIPPNGGADQGHQGWGIPLAMDQEGNIYSFRQETLPQPGTPEEPDDSPDDGDDSSFHFIPQAQAREAEEASEPVGSRVFQNTVAFTLNPPTVELASQCPGNGEVSPTFGLEVMGEARIQGNECVVQRFSSGTGEGQEIVKIPNCNRRQVTGMDTFSVSNPSGGEPRSYLAVSRPGKIHLVRLSNHPFVEYNVIFPYAYSLKKIVGTGANLYTFLGKSEGGEAPPYPLYRIGVDYHTQKMKAMCVPRSEALSRLETIDQVAEHQGKIAVVGQDAAGSTQLLVGSPEIRSDLSDTHLLSIAQFPNSVELAVLKSDSLLIELAILDSKEKKLHILSYPWFKSREETTRTAYSFSDLGLSNLLYPYQLAWVHNPSARELAFLDVREDGSELITLPMEASGNLDLDRIQRHNLGRQAPSLLIYLDGAWVFNHSEGGLRGVPTQATRSEES